MFKTADKDNDNLVTGISSYANLVKYDRSYNISNNNKLMDHSPIRQTFQLGKFISASGKSIINVVEL